MKSSKKKRILLFSVIGAVVAILLISLATSLIFRFDPLRKTPDEIIVYKYGKTYNLTPADESFQILYQQLRSAWEVSWNEQMALDSYKGNLGNDADIFFDSGLAIQVKYHRMQAATGWGATGSRYNDMVFLLDYPQDSSSEMSELDNSSIKDLLHKDNYLVYYSNREAYYTLSFIHFKFPQEAKAYILQTFNE